MSCRLGWENNGSLPRPLSYHPWFAENLIYKGETVIRTAYHQVWMGVLTIVYFHDTPLPIGNTQLYISSELGDQLLKSLKFTTSWAVVFVPPPKWILASMNILDELMSFLKMPMDASLIAIWRAFHLCLWFSPGAWWPLQIQIQIYNLYGFHRMLGHHHCNHQFLIPLVPEPPPRCHLKYQERQ